MKIIRLFACLLLLMGFCRRRAPIKSPRWNWSFNKLTTNGA